MHYEDERGRFELGWADGLLYPDPNQISGASAILDEEGKNRIVARVVQGIESEGHSVRIFGRSYALSFLHNVGLMSLHPS